VWLTEGSREGVDSSDEGKRILKGTITVVVRDRERDGIVDGKSGKSRRKTR